MISYRWLLLFRFFEKMSSIKTRKHYVIVDMAFSGLWAALFALAVLYMSFTWANTDEKYSFASANVLGAIFFAFLSVGVWVREYTFYLVSTG